MIIDCPSHIGSIGDVLYMWVNTAGQTVGRLVNCRGPNRYDYIDCPSHIGSIGDVSYMWVNNC